MFAILQSRVLYSFLLLFAGLPALVFILGVYPDRSVEKEIISAVVLLGFCFALGQVYWSRFNPLALKSIKMKKTRSIHELMGYLCIIILSLHPFLIVLPRFFSSMSDPLDALLIIVTTTSSTGVVFGLIAWVTMIILGLTSFFRKSLPISYKTWRMFHGILATLFLVTATYHAVSLGRHANTSMTVVLLLLAGSGVYLWVGSLFAATSKQGELQQ